MEMKSDEASATDNSPKASTSPGADSLENSRSDGETRYTAPYRRFIWMEQLGCKEKNRFFFSHNHKHQMSVIQVEGIVTIRIQYVITDLMHAFRS